MKITHVTWFNSPSGSIGVVFGEDEVTSRKKAYIGNARVSPAHSPSTSEADDALYITKTGSKLSLTMTKGFVDSLEEKKE